MKGRRLAACLIVLCLSAAATARVKIEAPELSSAARRNVRAHLQIDEENCESPWWRVRHYYDRIEEDIDAALRPFGFYGSRVEKSLVRTRNCWLATIGIIAGEPVRIREIDVRVSGEAEEDPEFQRTLKKLPLRKDEPLRHSRYEQIKSQLTDLAFSRGYLDARFVEQELRVYPELRAADMQLHFDSGQRFRFGELRISDHPLDDAFLARLAGWEAGRPFDVKLLLDLSRELSELEYFRSVNVRPLRDEAEANRIPVAIELSPHRRQSWRAGLGYQTDTEARLRVNYHNRFINGRGHRFLSELRISDVESYLSANYILPGKQPRQETFDINGAFFRERTTALESDLVQLGLRHTTTRERWIRSLFLELTDEDSIVGQERNSETLLMPGVTWQHLFTNNPLRTRRGYRASLELRAAREGLLSTSSFLQGTASARGIYRFGDRGRISGRTQFGATLTDDISDLPASLRFFTGGDTSVRGYDYQALGPRDADGEPVGGRFLLAGSVEYEHPIVGEDWWIGAFIDGGNAFNDEDFDPKFGYGGGLRWFSPVGKIQLDFAIPSDDFEDDWRFHFSIGADL